MKRILSSLSNLLLILTTLLLFSCEVSPEDICEEEEKCELTFNFCSSENNYYYQVGDNKYYCDEPFSTIEVSCASALAQATEDLCGPNISDKDIEEMTFKTRKLMDQILLSVRDY